MNQQQGDAMVAVVSEKTGLNAVLCAQHLALSLEFGRQMYPMQDSGTWSLATWRAANAGQTMEVLGPAEPDPVMEMSMRAMKAQTQAEDDERLRDRLAIETCFRKANEWQLCTFTEMNRAVNCFKAGWDARAQQEAKA